jgi:hypothetical protein
MNRRQMVAAVAALLGARLPIGFPGALVAQDLSEKQQLTIAWTELSKLFAPYAGDPILGGYQRSLVWLQDATAKWAPASAADGRPLRESVERMTRAIRNTPDGPAKTNLLSLVSRDLANKHAFCRINGLSSRRRVQVITKRDGITEVKGLEVLYLEKFLEADPTAKAHQFRGFSSPADDDLVPGVYVFWSREPGAGGRSGTRKESDVTEGQPSGPIEVLAP